VIGSPGAAPDAGETAITAIIGDGGLIMDPLADFHFGPSVCAPGGSLRITTRGSIAASPDASLAAGDSIASDAGGCAAQRGGDVILTAAGAIDAGPVRAGDGVPPGVVTRTAGASVDASIAPVSLTEPFVAVSRVYDLGQPSVVTTVKTQLRRPIAEGGVTIELSAADAATGPFGAWTTDPSVLGKHRFLRWRATVDRYFFEGAELDRLEIDYQ
jgi:hypothetical protein